MYITHSGFYFETTILCYFIVALIFSDLLEQKNALEAEAAATAAGTMGDPTTLTAESSLVLQSDTTPLTSQIIEEETPQRRSSNASRTSVSSKGSGKMDTLKTNSGSTPKNGSSSKKQSAKFTPPKRSPKTSSGRSGTSSKKSGRLTAKSSMKSQELSFTKSEIIAVE